jgi:type IV pilus assembly protein PilC
MVRVGEESNTLESNLKVIAEFYEVTAEERSSAALSMITPLSTVFIAAVAGFIAIAIIMPMYSLSGNIG